MAAASVCVLAASGRVLDVLLVPEARLVSRDATAKRKAKQGSAADSQSIWRNRRKSAFIVRILRIRSRNAARRRLPRLPIISTVPKNARDPLSCIGQSLMTPTSLTVGPRNLASITEVSIEFNDFSGYAWLGPWT